MSSCRNSRLKALLATMSTLVEYPLTHESRASTYGVNRVQKVSPRVGLCDVSMPSNLKRCCHHMRRVMLAEKDNVGFWSDFAYLAGGFESVHPWKANIQKNYVWLKFSGLGYRIFGVRSLTDHIQCWFF